MNPTETTTAIYGQVSEADAVSFVHTRPRLLGIARRTLIKKMVRYGIERPRADGARADTDGGTRH